MKIIGITYEDGNVSDVHVTTDGTDRVVLAPVRHGHWIEKMIPTGVYAFGVDEMTCEELECSICCKHFWVGEERNYCPNCGAKMDLDGESE